MRNRKIVGTHYTGDTWAPSFWSNINIFEIHDDLRKIKENGFNTIIIVVPWIGYQISVDPIRYFDEYYSILDHIFRMACQVGLNIILRVGYRHDIAAGSIQNEYGPYKENRSERQFDDGNPNVDVLKANGQNNDQNLPAHFQRVATLFTHQKIQDAWLNYLDRLYMAASKYDNFLFGFVSWEDFFILDYMNLSLDRRIFLSEKIGYQQYMTKYTLEEISDIYMQPFSNYTEIPIPDPKSPGVTLYYEFWQYYLIRLFTLSQKKFPKLSMEVRIDCDPSNMGTSYVCHESTFDLGGKGDVTIVYYSSAYRSENKGDQISASVALSRLSYLIDWVRSHTSNPIFIDQFNFVDNTPGFEKSTRIIPDEVPDFIDMSVSILRERTIGYALWTMKDIRANVITNGSFQRGMLGWHITHGRLLKGQTKNRRNVMLKNGGSLEQRVEGDSVRILFDWMQKKTQGSYCLEFRSKRNGLKSSALTVGILGKKENIRYHGETIISTDYLKNIAFHEIPLFSEVTLRITNHGADVVLGDFKLFCHVQENGIYDIDGKPKNFCNNIIALNRKLSAEQHVFEFYNSKTIQKASFSGLHVDGWTTDTVSGDILVPSYGGNVFVVEAYVPDAWVGYRNRIIVKINHMEAGSSLITCGYNKVCFSVETENLKNKIIPFNILSEKAYSVSTFNPDAKDQRLLSFILLGVGFAQA